jgi:hypothetical protein
MTDNDPLPDADETLEAEDATFDERELAGEVDVLDNAMDAGLQTPGAAREAFKAAEDDERA